MFARDAQGNQDFEWKNKCLELYHTQFDISV